MVRMVGHVRRPCWEDRPRRLAMLGGHFGLPEFHLAIPGSTPKLAPSWPHVGPCWAKLAPSWPQVGPMLAHVGPSWPKLAQVGPSWPQSWPKLAQVGPKMAPSWPMLAHVGSKFPRWFACSWFHDILDWKRFCFLMSSRPGPFVHEGSAYYVPFCRGTKALPLMPGFSMVFTKTLLLRSGFSRGFNDCTFELFHLLASDLSGYFVLVFL